MLWSVIAYVDGQVILESRPGARY